MTRLKDLRLERGFTQIKMQHLTGIDQATIQKLKAARDIIHLNTSGKRDRARELAKKGDRDMTVSHL